MVAPVRTVPLDALLARASPPRRVTLARRWLLDYAASSRGERAVVAAFVDLASGDSLAVTSGRADGVVLSGAPARWLARLGRRVWSVHNHPGGARSGAARALPSLTDVSLLARAPLECVEVCTAGGYFTVVRAGRSFRADGARWLAAVGAARTARAAALCALRAPRAPDRDRAHGAALGALARAGVLSLRVHPSADLSWRAVLPPGALAGALTHSG